MNLRKWKHLPLQAIKEMKLMEQKIEALDKQNKALNAINLEQKASIRSVYQAIVSEINGYAGDHVGDIQKTLLKLL